MHRRVAQHRRQRVAFGAFAGASLIVAFAIGPKAYRVNHLKIAQSMLRGALDDPSAAATVRAIMKSLARTPENLV